MVFSLPADHMGLLLMRSEQEFGFAVYDEDPERFVLLIEMMMKLDKNLAEKRQELVPDLISENDFWRNYFYCIELAKRNIGEANMLNE